MRMIATEAGQRGYRYKNGPAKTHDAHDGPNAYNTVASHSLSHLSFPSYPRLVGRQYGDLPSLLDSCCLAPEPATGEWLDG